MLFQGRYPVHFHLCRKTFGAFVQDSSVYDSNTRFITIHGTSGVSLLRNVMNQCFGHGVFLEDGVEVLNKIQWNLASHTKAGFKNTVNAYQHNPRGYS